MPPLLPILLKLMRARSAARRTGQGLLILALVLFSFSAARAQDTFRMDIGGNSAAAPAPGKLSPQSGEVGTVEFGSWNPGDITDADLNTAGAQAFPNIKDGSGNFVGLVITSFTNRGNPWFMRIRVLGPLTTGSATIPVQANSLVGNNDDSGGTVRWFGFAFSPEANGTFANSNNGNRGLGTQYNFLTTTPFTCYTSTVAEGNNLPNGTKTHYGFFIVVPPDQVPGNYSGEVEFTMTE